MRYGPIYIYTVPCETKLINSTGISCYIYIGKNGNLVTIERVRDGTGCNPSKGLWKFLKPIIDLV
jgi:hypothetical protein